MGKAPSFQWYPKDCDTDENVRAMDDTEFGFYMRCLNHSWLNNGLPSDLSEVAKILGRTKHHLARVWPRVSRCFELVNGRYVNLKQEEQKANYKSFVESRKKAANFRWEQVQSKTDARALHVECSPSASPSASAKTPLIPLAGELILPPTNGNGKHRRRTVSSVEDIRKLLGTERQVWWDSFWKVYPCRDGMKQGMEAFERIVKTRELAVEIFKGAEKYAARAAADPDMKLKYAQGWLNGERWRDAGSFKESPSRYKKPNE